MSKQVFGSQLRRGTQDRLKAALELDGSIVANMETINDHKGNTLAYLESLGLRKADLLRLERVGFAIRGYTPNYRSVPAVSSTGEDTTKHFYGPGQRVRWILLARGA